MWGGSRAVIILARLCMKPSPASWRIPASTIGIPVLRPAPALNAQFPVLDGVSFALREDAAEQAVAAPSPAGSGDGAAAGSSPDALRPAAA